MRFNELSIKCAVILFIDAGGIHGESVTACARVVSNCIDDNVESFSMTAVTLVF